MSDISLLTDHTGFWMRMVSNAVSQAFARKVADEGVTVAEWAFMRALFDLEPTTPTALANAMGMTRGAISKLADRLEAKGLVTERGALEDKRSRSLELTRSGRAKVPVLARLADENDNAFFGGLTRDDHVKLVEILKTLAATNSLKSTPVD